MKRPLIGLVIACLAPSIVSTQFPSQDVQQVKDAVQRRDHAAAIRQLKELEERDLSSFEAGDYDYLLARSSEAVGDLATAAFNYQRVANRGSILHLYAIAHLSRIARSTGNLLLERLYLLELTKPGNPESLLTAPAMERSARNAFEMGNYAATTSILESRRPMATTSTNGTDTTAGRDVLALLGEAHRKLGNIGRAREIFNSILSSTKDLSRPDSAAALSCRMLDMIDGGDEAKAPDIALDEHLRRAAVLQENRDFGYARLHYEAIAAMDAGGPNAADALFQIGRGLTQQGDFAGSLTFYSKVIEQYPDKVVAKDALLQSASANARLQRADEAVRLYERYIASYPSDDKLDRAYLNIVDVLRDKGADDEALNWCRKTEDAFKGKRPWAVTVFTEARIYIARGDWQSALEQLARLTDVADLGGPAVPGGTSKEEVEFLSAYCQEKQGSYAAAFDKYLSLPDGRDLYYGWRATEHLKLLAGQDVSRPAVIQRSEVLEAEINSRDSSVSRKAASALLRLTDDADKRQRALQVLRLGATDQLPFLTAMPPGYAPLTTKIGAVLAGLGLFDEAAPEMESATVAGSQDLTQADSYSLATVYFSAGRAMQLVEPLWRKVPADYPIEVLPRHDLEMFYPAPYSDLVKRYAGERGIDPRFLLSVMRQESRFDANAHSNAAARGLMQFISSTSDKVAAELGRSGSEPDDLYDPGTAILFGSQYLADLFKLFPDQPEAAAAAYNAGEDNMARWLARSKSAAPDQYVPEILYSQSKDYVYRVMANYRMYKMIYDGDLKPRPDK